jgi:hypothetical protein
VQMRYGKTHKSEMLTLAILCSAIAAQWFLIGTFPLSHPRRWWLEPGALITFSTPPVAALAFIPGEVSRLIFPLVALVVWGYWLGALTWRLSRWMWRSVARAWRVGR